MLCQKIPSSQSLITLIMVSTAENGNVDVSPTEKVERPHLRKKTFIADVFQIHL